MVVELLVAGQEVNGWNRFTPTILSSLKSMRYAAFSTAASTSVFTDNADNVCGFAWKFEARI